MLWRPLRALAVAALLLLLRLRPVPLLVPRGAHRRPSLLRRMCLSRVVLPEPRKPDRMVQGSLFAAPQLLPLAAGGTLAPPLAGGGDMWARFGLPAATGEM